MKKLLLFLTLCIVSSSYAQIINFPDANFKAKLVANSSVDDNGDGEIDVSEALDVTRMYIHFGDISDLTGIEYFTNLTEIRCDYNNISSLDLSIFPNMEKVNANNNNITSVNVSGLTNLEFLNLNNNELTSIDVSGLPSLYSILITNNQISSLDTENFPDLSRFNCGGNLLTTLDVSNLPSLLYLECENNLLESLNIQNGVFERTLDFSGNPTLTYICADVDQLKSVKEKIVAYGYTDCYVNSLCSYVSGQDFYTISGDILFDEDSNGCDMNDPIYPDLEFSLSDGTDTAADFSDETGNFQFDIQDGTYTVAPVQVNTTYFSVSPASVTVNFPADASPNIQDFCLTPNGVYNDLEIEFMSAGVSYLTGEPYPISSEYGIALSDGDQSFSFRIRYRNKGTTTQSGTLDYGFNPAEVISIAATPVADNQTSNSFSWNFTNLRPFESRDIIVVIQFTGQYMHSFPHAATVTPTDADFTPADNTMALTHEVFCCLLSTPEAAFGDYFTMYPNPANDVLNMKLKKELAVSSFTIYNMFGQKVKTIPYRNTELTPIDVSDLKTGQYFIRIATDETVFTTRFIKQ
ncbi:MAG: T9SS type A sorting domain-containing protein [Kordia sp.]|uniref:T9SS type A sorting domain-containing protein n=1 Tax=Kordia sp. TaxID=1965332 RepID=UPI00385F2DB5